MNRKSVRVAVTGAAGQIGYALLFRIASGQMFGLDTDVHLNLIELEQALPALNGVVMELDDCAFPLLKSVTQTSKLNVGFKDVDWALLVGSVPRKQGMERGDLLKINGKIFTEQGAAISANAKSTCRILVVGNPCNTNAYIAKESAPNIPSQNFFAMTMLDQNRAKAQLAQRAGVDVTAISNIAIWGNHSATQFPDFFHANINGQTATDVITDLKWLENDFISTVQKRGAAIIEARGLSSAASAANAVVDTVRALITPTPAGDYFSVAVVSNGEYGVDKGLVFSYPVRSNGETWEVVQGIEHGVFAQEKVQSTLKELIEERDAVGSILA